MRTGIADCLAHAGRWDGVFQGNLLIGFACLDSVEPGEGVGDVAQEGAVNRFWGVPSIYSSARPEPDRSPICRDYACMISSFVRARPWARPQTQTLSC